MKSVAAFYSCLVLGLVACAQATDGESKVGGRSTTSEYCTDSQIQHRLDAYKICLDNYRDPGHCREQANALVPCPSTPPPVVQEITPRPSHGTRSPATHLDSLNSSWFDYSRNPTRYPQR